MRRFAKEFAALAVLAVIVGVAFLVVPVARGFLAERAYTADQSLLQESVDAYLQSPSLHPPWPTLSGEAGAPREGDIDGFQCDGSDGGEVCSWLDFELLVSEGGLQSTDIILSAESTLNVGTTHAPSGRYGWYVDGEGIVASDPPFSADIGYP